MRKDVITQVIFPLVIFNLGEKDKSQWLEPETRQFRKVIDVFIGVHG